MTLDDDSSIYVGGLPYDATEDTIRTVFNLYGAILDVKIINDQRTVGKCYCFVTFTNPRSAIDAINDMNGRSISGRVVKVNGVKTRGGGGGGGRSNFGRERERYYHHNDERNGDWDRGRDREIRDQDYDRGSGRDHMREQNYDHGNEKDGYRSRGGDWTRHGDRSRDRERSRDRDRSRDHDRGRDRRVEHVQDYDDQARERMLDDDWNRDDDRAENQQENSRVHGGDVDRDHNLDVDTDRKMDRVSDPDKSFDEPKREPARRNIDLNVTNENSPSDSTDDHYDEAEDELEQSMQELDKLKKEVSKLDGRVEERRLNVTELQKHSKKLEDAVITAKKQSLYRQMQLTKLHECFLQVQDSTERLKTSEKEFQALVDSVMFESDGDGSLGQLTNGTLDGK
ncbi:unnamed protein product [Lathyrus sativus]|nr:unnamed protein product [Lathyrus sativus]